MSASAQLATALAIIAEETRLLVWRNTEGNFELPGFVVAKEEIAIQALEEFITKLNLDEMPQQTLYLTAVLAGNLRRRIPAIVRVIRLPEGSEFTLDKAFFESCSRIMARKRVSPLTKLVAEWIMMK